MRVLLLVALVACGGDGGKDIDATTIDGTPRDAGIDAPPDAPTAVRQVVCPANPAQTITTSNFMFMPTPVSINRDQIVKLAPENLHNVIPHPSKPSDPGLRSGATGEVRCVQFTATGQFNYRCGPHPSMEGVVNVN